MSRYYVRRTDDSGRKGEAVTWLPNTVNVGDLFALSEALTELGHQAEEHHQEAVEVPYVVEEILRHAAPARSTALAAPETSEEKNHG